MRCALLAILLPILSLSAQAPVAIGYSNMGSVGGVTLQVYEVPGGSEYAVHVATERKSAALSESQTRALVAALDSMIAIKSNPTSLQLYRLEATLSDDLSIIMTELAGGNRDLMVRVGDVVPEYGYVPGPKVRDLRDKFAAALDTIAAARTRKRLGTLQ